MKKQILFLLFVLIVNQSYAQLIGAEECITVNRFKGTFRVDGDMNTYYPVIFKYGGQNKINHLKIYRSYHEGGPDALHLTHKGDLSLEIDVNYGGWGGSTYDWRIMDLRQTYHTTFAKASHGMHYMGFIVWLRGGGFIYHYESDKNANLQVCYSNEKIYDHEVPAYVVYAPNSLSTQDLENINAHKNDHWNYIKGKPFDSRGHLGILTSPSNYPLDVNGIIRAKEIKVESEWADFVFEDDYQLKSLQEVEAFINENGHLPDIPSEGEVKKDGISVGEMNTKLLQKIEELTLYMIQQNKKMNLQSKEISKLKLELQEVKQRR